MTLWSVLYTHCCLRVGIWHDCVLCAVMDVQPIAQDIAASVAEAPWNSLAPVDDYDAAEPRRLGLGCSALPDHEYQEEASADAPPQSSSRPIYDRCVLRLVVSSWNVALITYQMVPLSVVGVMHATKLLRDQAHFLLC